jgi:acyl carrier protein
MGLDTVEFVLWAEQEFEIEIPDNDAQFILTVGQFTTYVHRKLFNMHGAASKSEAEIFKRIKDFLIAEFEIAPEKISRDSNFVKDLGLDR